MLNSKSIQGIVILILGLFLAVWLGLSIVTNQTETILQIIAAIAFIICLALGRKIWLIIPLMAALNISLRIPGQPDSLLLGHLLLMAFTAPLLLMRKLPFKIILTELEWWIIIVTLFVAQAYMRNPVGLNILGGDTVGGKGYSIYIISLISTFLISGLRVPTNDLKWIWRLSIIGGLLNTAISTIGMVIPSISYYTNQSYEDTSQVNYENSNKVVDQGAATRVGFLLGLSSNLSIWISSCISPIRALTKPLWCILVLAAVVAGMLSGYRNGIIIVGLTFLIGIMYRSGLKGFSASILGGIGGVALLAAVNSLNPLPPNIQRSLTFLPGTWDQRYVLDAQWSSEWRYEVWREALLTNRWIKNKWIGDGLGFSAADFTGALNRRKGASTGISGFDDQRESILRSGDYHSGPVSTIRVIGYIGLAFYLIAQFRVATHAHRLIKRHQRTEWYSLTLLIGIPIITTPIIFIFIFGDFKLHSCVFLLSISMIRLLQNNLPKSTNTTPLINNSRIIGKNTNQ